MDNVLARSRSHPILRVPRRISWRLRRDGPPGRRRNLARPQMRVRRGAGARFRPGSPSRFLVDHPGDVHRSLARQARPGLAGASTPSGFPERLRPPCGRLSGAGRRGAADGMACPWRPHLLPDPQDRPASSAWSAHPGLIMAGGRSKLAAGGRTDANGPCAWLPPLARHCDAARAGAARLTPS